LIVRNHNYREAPWDAFHADAHDLTLGCGVAEA
jgi:hypothetical protein